MKMSFATPAALGLAAVALAGCVGSVDGPQSPEFGASLAEVRAQAVEVTPTDQPPETSGQAAAAGVRRYHEGRTKPVEAYATSTIGGDSGSAGAGMAPDAPQS